MGYIYNQAAGGPIIGRVDPDGKIYNQAAGGPIIGRVDPDGKIYNQAAGGSIIGRVDPDGKIYNQAAGGPIIGRVNPDGKIYNQAAGGPIIGRVDGGILAGGAALLLLDLTPGGGSTGSSSSPGFSSTNGSADSGGKTGCLGMVLMFFGFIFLKLPIGGKICALAGLILPIIIAIIGDNGNYALVAPFGFFIGGGIGALGNFIFTKLSKTGKRGALIGAVVLIIAFEIMLFTGDVSTALGNVIGFGIFGLIIGFILGAVVGLIVGLIQKKTGKK
jgi:hypothetical protein